MGSLVVKLDKQTQDKLENRYFYSDIDMLNYKKDVQSPGGTTLVDLPVVYDVEAVKQSVRNILMWRVGESVLRPEFGHNLHKSMYTQMTTFNKDKVAQEIQRAIDENEPRVEVESVAAEPDSENNALKVQVVYTVVGNKADGMKFMEQATISGK